MSRDAACGMHTSSAGLSSASLPGRSEEGEILCTLEHHRFSSEDDQMLVSFSPENAIHCRLPVVIESVNSHANRFLCMQSSGSWAFDFHLLFSLAACSVSMQISSFIQFSVGKKTTISPIIISVNKRETLNWIFTSLQMQWDDADLLPMNKV